MSEGASVRVNKVSCEQRERFLAGRGRRHRMRAEGATREGSGQRRTDGRVDGRGRMEDGCGCGFTSISEIAYLLKP